MYSINSSINSFINISGGNKGSQNVVELRSYAAVKKAFTPAPFISFRSARNSKVYSLDRKVDSEKCKGKRCLVCLSISEM